MATRHTRIRQARRARLAALAAGALLATAAQAQAVLFQENFGSGLGQFTATGTVGTGTGAAVIQGCYGCTDGAIVSRTISTAGHTGIRLSYDRQTSGLDSGEYGVSAYLVSGGTWTAIENITSASGRVTLTLPAAVENQSSVQLRFRVSASLSSETLTIDNVVLEGTPTSSGGSGAQKGPDPTVASLEASAGPFTVATRTVSSSAASGYGGGTIYYPSNLAGTMGGIVVIPGYTAYQSSVSWWGSRLASHGFIVMTIDTHSIYDLPPARATQLMAAVNQLKVFNTTAGHAIQGKLDPARMGIMGWSYGGGGTLIAARDNPSLKAAIPFTPKTTTGTDFSGITMPTLIIGCESDSTAPVNSWSIPFYNSIPGSVKKGYLEINNGDHFCPTTTGPGSAKPILGKVGVSWMKRFIDNDTRYSPFLCGAPHQADVANTSVVSDYRENCPY